MSGVKQRLIIFFSQRPALFNCVLTVSQVLKKTQQHCTDHRIPFPHIDFSRVEKEAMKEVYVFEDEKNPKAPIVVHFPLANLTFREFKSPG